MPGGQACRDAQDAPFAARDGHAAPPEVVGAASQSLSASSVLSLMLGSVAM